MTEHTALRLIREIAADSSRVFLSAHARQRMRERHISVRQVFECLKRGQIAEPPHQDTRGDWKCTVSWLHAGDDVNVAVAFKRDEQSGELLIVITVFAN